MQLILKGAGVVTVHASLEPEGKVGILDAIVDFAITGALVIEIFNNT